MSKTIQNVIFAIMTDGKNDNLWHSETLSKVELIKNANSLIVNLQAFVGRMQDSDNQPTNPTTRIKAIAGRQYAIYGKQYTAENTIEGCLGCAFEKSESCADAPLCSGADFSVRFKIVGDENEG